MEGVEEGGAAEGDSTSSDDAVAPSTPGAAPRGDWADWQRVFAADEDGYFEIKIFVIFFVKFSSGG